MISAVKTILSTISKLYRLGVPAYVLSFGESLGDNLLLTILAKELHKKHQKKTWIKCDYPQLYQHNPFVAVIPYNTLLSTTLLNLMGAKIIPLKYTAYDPLTDQNKIPEKHIVLKMADTIGLNGAIENKPDFYLTGDESEKGIISKKQIAITVSNTSAKIPVKNKEWFDERYQEIVDRFRAEYDFVQIGAHNDYALKNVTDLRGKTTLRESAAILKNSVLLIAYAGFTMHLARAVDCRSVIVYGGRETPAQTGYNSFRNIYSAVHCSPCWLNNRCNYNRMCMTEISVEMVISEVLKELESINTPLPVDTLCN